MPISSVRCPSCGARVNVAVSRIPDEAAAAGDAVDWTDAEVDEPTQQTDAEGPADADAPDMDGIASDGTAGRRTTGACDARPVTCPRCKAEFAVGADDIDERTRGAISDLDEAGGREDDEAEVDGILAGGEADVDDAVDALDAEVAESTSWFDAQESTVIPDFDVDDIASDEKLEELQTVLARKAGDSLSRKMRERGAPDWAADALAGGAVDYATAAIRGRNFL